MIGAEKPRVPVLLPCRGQARNLTETPENLTQFLNIRAPARVACYFIIEFRQFYSPLLRLYLKEEAFPFRPHSLSNVGLNKSLRDHLAHPCCFVKYWVWTLMFNVQLSKPSTIGVLCNQRSFGLVHLWGSFIIQCREQQMITDHKSCTRLSMNIELDKAVFVILSATSARKTESVLEFTGICRPGFVRNWN